MGDDKGWLRLAVVNKDTNHTDVARRFDAIHERIHGQIGDFLAVRVVALIADALGSAVRAKTVG
jgi:hypothetical protein